MSIACSRVACSHQPVAAPKSTPAPPWVNSAQEWTETLQVTMTMRGDVSVTWMLHFTPQALSRMATSHRLDQILCLRIYLKNEDGERKKIRRKKASNSILKKRKEKSRPYKLKQMQAGKGHASPGQVASVSQARPPPKGAVKQNCTPSQPNKLRWQTGWHCLPSCQE